MAGPGPAQVPPELLRAAAHVFVADLEAVELDDGDAHHLLRVLRLRDGEAVTVADGTGRWRSCAVAGGRLAPDGPVVEGPRPEPEVAIALPALKGDRTEWAVGACTQLGVDRIIVLDAARAVVRWPADRVARHLDRLRAVAREAAMQSRRLTVPEVSGPMPVGELDGFAVAGFDGAPPSLATPAVAVGPEGGFTDAELAAAAAVVGLGPTVLRAETAAVSTAALLCAIRTGHVTAGG